ncbi:MAG: class I SAM-dependent methyltransferase [Candidatus Omnitrophica bacterium]|nr:class I SAM-dependent methyltransferase [Candidatus Omnitrophota bacterium]
MCISLKKHFATAKRPLEWCISQYPIREKHVMSLMQDITHKVSLNSDSKILEIGAAQGLFLIALKQLGFRNCVGLEPSEDALNNVSRISKEFNISLDIRKGFAESIPFESNTFDLMIADSVMEHVKDPKVVLNEVFRALKKGGAFYFSSTSCLCPYQSEVGLFPFFSWYPNIVKMRVIKWCMKKAPSLIGYTDTPAINWFTPWKVKRLSENAGFHSIYDRWNLVDENRFSPIKRTIIRVIRRNAYLKFCADLVKSGSAYLLIKEKS